MPNLKHCQYGYSFNHLIFVKMHGLDSEIWQEARSPCDMNEIAVECNRGGDESGSSVLPTKRRRVTKVDPMHFYYVGTGDSQSTFAKPFDALRVDVFLPV
jgi:hypothetical protein